MSEYFAPQYKSRNFHCAYCHVYASQYWKHVTSYDKSHNTKPRLISINQAEVEISLCSHCGQPTFWLREQIIFPPMHASPPANNDLPGNVQEIYKEAASIANRSPRAACALLRLAIEMLLKHLGETSTINESIKNLVKKGLDVRIQQALDIVRVTGNNAVHPGEIDFNDSTDVQTLFGLINLIADRLITQPKQVAEMYNQLPEEDRDRIRKRDGKTE